MNDMKSISEQFTSGSANARMLDKADVLISEFERLLESELHLLSNGKVDGLESICTAKHVLVQQINLHESGFIELFENNPEHSHISGLKQRLIQCRVNSRHNHALVLLELKHTNRSLELLRSVLMMDDLSLYTERGNVRVNREKRRLGSA